MSADSAAFVATVGVVWLVGSIIGARLFPERRHGPCQGAGWIVRGTIRRPCRGCRGTGWRRRTFAPRKR